MFLVRLQGKFDIDQLAGAAWQYVIFHDLSHYGRTWRYGVRIVFSQFRQDNEEKSNKVSFFLLAFQFPYQLLTDAPGSVRYCAVI